jgi:predicted nucleotidyltransferase/DNA-binding XRE family transcriptional regulator
MPSTPGERLSTIRYSGQVQSGPRGAAEILREARLRAGLTQTELARRARVTQSVVSVYETGQRAPSLQTLARLVDAAGLELAVTVRSPTRFRAMSGPIGNRVRRHRAQIVDLAAAHGVTNVRVFGSVTTGRDRPDSDVDLVVDPPQDMGIFALGRLRDDLEALLGAPVDLVPEANLKPEVKREIAGELIAL